MNKFLLYAFLITITVELAAIILERAILIYIKAGILRRLKKMSVGVSKIPDNWTPPIIDNSIPPFQYKCLMCQTQFWESEVKEWKSMKPGEFGSKFNAKGEAGIPIAQCPLCESFKTKAL